MATATITANGLLDLRQYVETNWSYIEIYDDVDAVIVRLPISDPRVTWVDDATTNPLRIEAVLTGSDADIDIGDKVYKAALFKEAAAGTAKVTATYDRVFEFLNDEDQVIVRIEVQIPSM